MRYIFKKWRCNKFDKYLKRKKHVVWDRFDPDVKFALYRHLWKEQKGLCIYCEQAIPEKVQKDTPFYRHPSHIEHIRPKSKFKHLMFSYHNLSVACNGFNCSSEDEQGEFCEFKKKDLYDTELFLNPVEVQDIESYFVYDIDGNIKPNSDKSEEGVKKAQYMIDLLDLQNPTLKKMRTDQMDLFLEEQTNGQDILALLDERNYLLPGFYTMLKQFFGVTPTTEIFPEWDEPV